MRKNERLEKVDYFYRDGDELTIFGYKDKDLYVIKHNYQTGEITKEFPPLKEKNSRLRDFSRKQRMVAYKMEEFGCKGIKFLIELYRRITRNKD